jgi:hypothetical protein
MKYKTCARFVMENVIVYPQLFSSNINNKNVSLKGKVSLLISKSCVQITKVKLFCKSINRFAISRNIGLCFEFVVKRLSLNTGTIILAIL